jgi:GNAT superfamily N-acetyltransferase
MAPGDVKFVMSTWMRALRSDDRSPLPDDLFFNPRRELARRILSDRRVAVLVAHLPEDPDKIIGFGIAEPGVMLHWLHVKEPYRGEGVAVALLEALQCPPEIPRSHRSRSDRALANPHRPQLCRDRYRSES